MVGVGGCELRDGRDLRDGRGVVIGVALLQGVDHRECRRECDSIGGPITRTSL